MLGTTAVNSILGGQQIAENNFRLGDLFATRLTDTLASELFAQGSATGGFFGGLQAQQNSGFNRIAQPAFANNIASIQAATPFFDAAAAAGGAGLQNARFALNGVVPGAGSGLTSGTPGAFAQRASASGFNSGNNFAALNALLGLGQNGGDNILNNTNLLLRQLGFFGNNNTGNRTGSAPRSSSTGASTTRGTAVRAVNNTNLSALPVDF